MIQITKFTHEYEIRAYNCNTLEELTLKNLAHFFQDVADRQSAEYNYGYDYLKNMDIAWILVNYHIIIDEMPRWGDVITIHSWVSTLKKISSRREFEVVRNGKIIVRASTQWVALNLKTKKFSNVLDFMGDFKPLEEHAINSAFSKIRKCDEMQFQKSFTTRYDDLDPNRHVNNANYFAWSYEAFGEEWLQSKKMTEIEVNFKSETYYGDTLDYSCAALDDTFIQIATKVDGTEAVAIRTKWEGRT